MLTWRGGGAGEDPFADDGEMTAPTSGDAVCPGGARRTCGNEIGTEESWVAGRFEMGTGL